MIAERHKRIALRNFSRSCVTSLTWKKAYYSHPLFSANSNMRRLCPHRSQKTMEVMKGNILFKNKTCASHTPDPTHPSKCNINFIISRLMRHLHNELHPLFFINVVICLRKWAAGCLLTTFHDHIGAGWHLMWEQLSIMAQ